jgi:exosortase family protein XrtM
MSAAHPADAALRSRYGVLGFAARAVALALGFFAVLFLAHAPDSSTGRALAGYLTWLARACGSVVAIFDPSAVVHDRVLSGRFSLEIVLDCGALDVQALFAAAVLAFPAPWRQRAAGLAGGLLALNGFNVLRIVTLYFVGAHAPGWFHTLHEEIFQIVIVAIACLLFALWAMWARPAASPSIKEASVATA